MENQQVFKSVLPGMEFQRTRRTQEYDIGKHQHKEFELYYLNEGERYYFIGTKSYKVQPGCLVFINRSQIHKTGGTQSRAHERTLIMLSTSRILKINRLIPAVPVMDLFQEEERVLQLSQEGQREVEELLLKIQRELAEDADPKELLWLYLAELFALAKRFRTRYGRQSAAVKDKHSKYHKVSETAAFLTEHYQECYSLEQLAGRCYVSTYYLSRIFKEVTGYTIREYQNLERVRQSQRLLEDSACTITEVAETVGFDSITYFERVFKKFTGQCPREYRHKNS